MQFIHSCLKHGQLEESDCYREKSKNVRGFRYRCIKCHRIKCVRSMGIRRSKHKLYCQLGTFINSYKSNNSITIYNYHLDTIQSNSAYLTEIDALRERIKELEKKNVIEHQANERLLNRLTYVEETGRVGAPRMLRITDVIKRTGVARSTIYYWMLHGQFPRSVNLGERIVGWREKDIEDWMAQL